jgi:integrase
MEIGPRTASVLDEVWQASLYHADDSFVFGHPTLGTAVDPTKLSRDYMRPALTAAGITKPFRPWHDLRHTALTHEAAAGNPHAYVQAKAGHSQSTITDRYIHAAQVLFPGAAERAQAPHVRGRGVAKRVAKPRQRNAETRKPRLSGAFLVAGAGFEPATSGL